MNVSRRTALKLIGAGAGAAALSGTGAAAGAAAADRDDGVLSCDVAILGGGATGTYAAVRLRDLGRSVVVIEAGDRLGGHTQTWTDPVTGGPVDIGVIVFHDLPVVRSYFGRFGIPLTTADFTVPGGVTKYVDFGTGAEVAGFVPPDPSAALGAYAAQIARYPYLGTGYDLPDPVPADLLLPFGDFVRRYGLGDAVRTIAAFGQGLGDILRQPTLYVAKNFGLDVLTSLQTGFLTTARHRNGELYDRALAELGDAVLLRGRVIAADRTAPARARLAVRTPSGTVAVLARKVLVTVPPTIGNLSVLGLDTTEAGLFRTFGNSAYYTGVLRGTGIPGTWTLDNVRPDTTYGLPQLPAIYSVYPTGLPDLHNVKYGSTRALSSTEVKADILAAIGRLRVPGVPPAPAPELAVFASHTPFELTVPADTVKAGFYRQLSALQGRNRTFYTGAAFHTHDSSLLWRFTETLLPRL
ncbi:MAG TPA: FAD-dependent oxidoreductase [Mycobacteriales bacterium]